MKKKNKLPGTVIEDLTGKLDPIFRLIVVGPDGKPEGTLSNVVLTPPPQGIRIVGNGTLTHPLRVELSAAIRKRIKV